MKTEEQARKCWCPFAMTFGRLTHYRESEPVGVSYGPQNRGTAMGGKLDTCLCIASECMAWRWNEAWPIGEVPGKDGIITKDGQRIGYCGLAGKP